MSSRSDPAAPDALDDAVARTCRASGFVHGLASTRPEVFARWRAEDRWGASDAAGTLAARVDAATDVAGEGALMRALRQVRQREMVRIAVRAIGFEAPLDETLNDLSELADACCARVLAHAAAAQEERFGIPADAEGRAVRPFVLGMGKLGGRELNFSSDIDLIFGYTAEGDTRGGRATCSNEEFFGRVVQTVSRLLSERTPDGFVFRVDTLLRPFGSVGRPAISTDAMERYYEAHGREWERYALVKARPVAGDVDAARALLLALQPFVYRRYLDYNALGSLRALKKLIDTEAAKHGAEDDLKLGPGGIRELEFIVQLFQLMRGGQDARLRDPRLRPVLRFLGTSGQLAADRAEALDAAYVFLRRAENAVQMHTDAQTHRLPEDDDARAALCTALGFADWRAFRAALEIHRTLVRREFERLFSPMHAAGTPEDEDHRLGHGGASISEERLRRMGFRGAAAEGAAAIERLRGSHAARSLGEASQLRLSRVIRRLAEVAMREVPEDPDTALLRTLEVIATLAGRSTYTALLDESAAARRQLVRLCAASPWIADLLARNPALLDALLDTRLTAEVPQREAMVRALTDAAHGIDRGDTEAQMALLRRYRQETMLRVAAADLAGTLPLAQVSDRLTWLAEAVVAQALRFAREAVWLDETPAQAATRPFAVIAYGKFGSIELGYGSDLDLVFVHRAEADDARVARLAQRVVTLLSALTAAGRAYEVDLQLRPSGNSGLVVTGLAGFARYQRESAWVWEHQALLRARPVAGDDALSAEIEAVRQEVLLRARDAEALRRAVIEMRARMRTALEKREAGRWDVKQGAGGLIDAEFLTQFLCLRFAHEQPALIRYTDNWRQLEALAAAGRLGADEAQHLLAAERAYRGFLHRRALQQQDAQADEAQFGPERAAVSACWRKVLDTPVESA